MFQHWVHIGGNELIYCDDNSKESNGQQKGKKCGGGINKTEKNRRSLTGYFCAEHLNNRIVAKSSLKRSWHKKGIEEEQSKSLEEKTEE